MHDVVIMSDSHGLTNEIERVKKRHPDACFIHCGDSELEVESKYLENMLVVKGNCDWGTDFPLERVVEIGGLRFFISHGHLFHVKSTLLQLQYRALEVEADIVCFGHSHIAFADQIDHQLFINPGSIRSPRKYSTPSYCHVQWKDRNENHITFYQPNGEKIDHFPFKRKFLL